MENKLVKKIIQQFEIELVNNDADTSREVESASMHRMGIELSSDAVVGQSPNIIGWGTKERKFLDTKSSEYVKKVIAKIITKKTPLVFLSMGMNEGKTKDIILDVCKSTKTPVVSSESHLSEINIMISPYLAAYLSPSVTIHASLVIVNGYGVVIRGKSGIGKSEAVLELIQKGNSFVSDDSVVIKRIGNKFFGEPASITRGVLEVRGIGLIDVPFVYGQSTLKEQAEINLIVDLIDSQEIKDVDRLGSKEMDFKVLNGSIPRVELPIKIGRSTSVLVETAIEAFVSRKKGMNAIALINKRSRE